MPNNKPIIDIHVHSTLKPYGQSIKNNQNPFKYISKACIWKPNDNGMLENYLESEGKFARYRQSDFTSLTNGNISIAFVSLYPTEIGFNDTNIPKAANLFSSFISNIISAFSRKRHKFLKGDGINGYYYYYFDDLQLEYEYLKLLNKKEPKGLNKKYHLMRNGIDELPQNETDLNIVITIEGAHVFCDGRHVEQPANWNNLEANILKVKNWEHPPFFITIGHHFYNALCTHALSLTDRMKTLLDQRIGMRESGEEVIDGYPDAFTFTGLEVIKLLLRKNKTEKRILIDIKHMSVNSRNQYYNILDSNYKDENIPIICSHGGVRKYYEHDISMSDADIIRIYNSGGLMGVELDERILGKFEKPANEFIENFQGVLNHNEIDAYYVWRQIEHIAELAFQNGHDNNPWKCLCIGSDYDGIINPLDSYRIAYRMPVLYDNLIAHANRYFAQGNQLIPLTMPTDQILHLIMYENAREFLRTHYN